MTEPYYIVPLVERYRELPPDSNEARNLSRKIAANVGDFASLRLILGIDPPEFAKFYPDMEINTPSTLDTIDSFLDKFGKNLPPVGYVPEGIQEENLELETPDREFPDQPAMSESESIPQETEQQTLNRLIKERRFSDALEFIKAQNLNNPNKSIYFAHQMRFLKKLINIENYKNRMGRNQGSQDFN